MPGLLSAWYRTKHIITLPRKKMRTEGVTYTTGLVYTALFSNLTGLLEASVCKVETTAAIATCQLHRRRAQNKLIFQPRQPLKTSSATPHRPVSSPDVLRKARCAPGSRGPAEPRPAPGNREHSFTAWPATSNANREPTHSSPPER